MTKSNNDLETKTNALDAELEKVKVSEVLTQTVYELNKVPTNAKDGNLIVSVLLSAQ